MRCYNGCPDSELQALIDNKTRLLKAIQKIVPDAHLTDFHSEGFQVWAGLTPLGPMCFNATTCLQRTLDRLEAT